MASDSAPPFDPHFDRHFDRHDDAGAAPALVAEQRQLFQRVLGTLSRCGVEYAVAGAFAFQHYTGIWRFTKDLDLFLPKARVAAALALCRAAGLVTEITDPVWLAKAWAGDYYVDLISGMSNGALWVTPEWIAHGQAATVLEQPVRMLAPEEMILSKLFVTRRERFDGSDVCHLLYACGKRLDWTRLVAAAGHHWELLAWQVQLFRYVYPASFAATVPAALWREWLRRLGAAPHGAFRGTLIDPLMFAPDVQEWGLENLEDGSRKARLETAA